MWDVKYIFPIIQLCTIETIRPVFEMPRQLARLTQYTMKNLMLKTPTITGWLYPISFIWFNCLYHEGIIKIQTNVLIFPISWCSQNNGHLHPSNRLIWYMFVCVHLQRPDCWLCLRLSRWSLNGTLIDLGSDYRRHMSGGNLIINSLDRDQDTGIYQCTAFNTWGIILSCRATLQFACKWLGYF